MVAGNPRLDVPVAAPLIRLDQVRFRATSFDCKAIALLVVLTLVTFAPTVRNGFLSNQFDDAIILRTPALRELSWENTRRLFGEFNQAHYVPLTLLSLSVNHALGGFEPFGYHLGNVFLHAFAVVLAYLFLAAILPARDAALLAAALYAVHPVQLESVTLAIQRKTVLSGAFFFLTLILYQRWVCDRRPTVFVAAVLAFAAAALSKATVMTLPLVLILYDVCFVGGPLRWKDKIPFLLVAAMVGATAQLAHAEVGASYGPYGGSWLTHFPVIARVLLDYLVALVVPYDLAPMYFYKAADLVNAPLSFAALALVLAALGYVVASARRRPWLFFCVGWFAILFAPESNLVPISYLRADRFLYLPLLGFTAAAALLWNTSLQTAEPQVRRLLHVLAVLVVIAYASQTLRTIPVWANDVTAWTRCVERAPTVAFPHYRFALTMADEGDLAAAERSFRHAARLRPKWVEPHVALARLYAKNGLVEPARAAAARALELAPDDKRKEELEEIVRGGDGG